MKRREFIAQLGGAAASWPLAARAQDAGRSYRVGMLFPFPRDAREAARARGEGAVPAGGLATRSRAALGINPSAL